jgi:hypothetical protein
MRTPTDEHLADQIVKLSRNGTITTPFRVGDYRERFPEVSENLNGLWKR